MAQKALTHCPPTTISAALSAAATPTTAAVKEPRDPMVSSPPSPSESSVKGTPFASEGSAAILFLRRFRYDCLWALGRTVFSATST